MDSVVDIIRNATYVEQNHDSSDLDIENELRHPFTRLRNSFDCDENEEILFSETHVRTSSALYNDSDTDGRWFSLDDLFKNLRVEEDFRAELSPNVKSCLKEMLYKVNLSTCKSRESLSRKFSTSSGKKYKSEWKSSIKGDIRDTKTERKLSLLFTSQRKRSSVNENVRKKIEESILKIGKRTALDENKGRKCSTDEKIKKKGIDESVATSRKQSSVSQKLESRSSKKLEMKVDEFLLSSSHYLSANVNDLQQMSRDSIPWSLTERTRNKVTHWLNK